MATKERTKAAKASRRNGKKGGRPTWFGEKTERFDIQLTREAKDKIETDAAALGTSRSNAIEAAVREFDARGYAKHRAEAGEV